MKKVLALLVLYPILVIGSPADSLQILQEKISVMSESILRLQRENKKLLDINNLQGREIEVLQQATQQQSKVIDSIANVVSSNYSTTEATIEKNQAGTEGRLQAMSNNIMYRTLLGLVGFFTAVILLCVVYYHLKKRISRESSTLSKIKLAQEGLETAQKAMQEESVKLDNKLVGLLDKQVATQPQNNSYDDQPDHSLALKVADEIVRIETNLSRMDESVKGFKQLKKAVERIRTNFLANGYEIVEMLGKPYNEGMKVVANFVSDDTLGEGEQKITGIIKPQINYKGKMIQSAQITVSQNL